MSEENLYLFQVNVKKINISSKKQGQISLILRIGKLTSSIVKAKSFNDKEIIFNCIIKCNCDKNALDTGRFSLTLNMRKSKLQRQVLGIVMISFEKAQTNEFKSYKISQSKDSEASISLKYQISQINQNGKIKKKSSVQFQNQLIQSIQQIQNPEINLSKQKQNFYTKQVEVRSTDLIKNTTSQFALQVEQIKLNSIKQENFKNLQNQNIKIKQQNKILLEELVKIRKQKQLLKGLLKIETNKNMMLSNFLDKTVKIISQQTPFKNENLRQSQKGYAQSFKQRQRIKHQDQKQGLLNIQSSKITPIQQNSGFSFLTENSLHHQLDFQRKHTNLSSQLKVIPSNLSSLGQQFTQILKDCLKQRNASKNVVEQLKKTFRQEIDNKHQRKLRSVKIKLQKSYLQLLGQEQPYKKEHIVQHKISVNKILDELVMCQVTQ